MIQSIPCIHTCMINSNGKFDKSKSKLGEDHPDTLASMNNFIVIKTTTEAKKLNISSNSAVTCVHFSLRQDWNQFLEKSDDKEVKKHSPNSIYQHSVRMHLITACDFLHRKMQVSSMQILRDWKGTFYSGDVENVNIKSYTAFKHHRIYHILSCLAILYHMLFIHICYIIFTFKKKN